MEKGSNLRPTTCAQYGTEGYRYAEMEVLSLISRQCTFFENYSVNRRLNPHNYEKRIEPTYFLIQVLGSISRQCTFFANYSVSRRLNPYNYGKKDRTCDLLRVRNTEQRVTATLKSELCSIVV